MKLSQIVAELTSLKDTVAGFIGDKTKATTEALTSFSSKLSTLESGAVAELSQKTTDLASAQESNVTLKTDLQKEKDSAKSIFDSLKASCTALSLDIKEGATANEMITAMQTAVSSTLAKVQVDASKVPAAVPTKAGESAPTKKMSLDEQVAAQKASVTPTK